MVSDSDTCATISIQKNICPIHDLKYDIEYDGMFQSMTKLAAITVTSGFSVSYLGFSVSYFGILVEIPRDLA